MIPPIATLTSDLDGDRVLSLNQGFPVSCARDEPSGTKPLLEPFSFPSTPPQGGTNSRSRKTRSLAKLAIQAQDKSSSSYHHQGLEKAKVKRKKIQVERSFRVLRPRGCQPVITNQEILDGGTSSSAIQLIQDDKENDGSEIPDLEALWDKWRHVRGTIRRPK